jgi:YHS domain-containing protein
METKICNKCNTEKAIDSFEKITDKRRGDTYFFMRKTCKKCIQARKLELVHAKKLLLPKKEIKEYNPRYTFNNKKINAFRLDPKPIYCDYGCCRLLLPQEEHLVKVHNKKKYHFCDEWCLQNELPEIRQVHTCKYCPRPVEPIMRKEGQIAAWRLLCDECLKFRNVKREKKVFLSEEEIYQDMLNSLVYKGDLGFV